MKVLKISSLFPPYIVGGAEIVADIIAKSLSDLGHEVHVATLQPPVEEFVDSMTDGNAVHVHRIPLANIYWPFRAHTKPSSFRRLIWHSIDTANFPMASRVSALIAKINPDVVVTHNLQGFSTAVLPAIKRRGIPLVHVLHDYSLLCPNASMYKNDKNCGPKDRRCNGCRVFSMPRWKHTTAVDAVIGVSQSILDFHRDHGLFTNIPAEVIYNPLSENLVIQNGLPARGSGDLFTFGFLGRISKTKGIDTFVQAAHRLQSEGREFRVLIGGRGDPDYMTSLQQKWPVDNLSFEGFVEPAAFLRSLDTLVFPSYGREALGMGVYEAFSQGVTVIGSKSGGIVESIDHDVNGFLFDSGSVSQLADHMRSLLDDPLKHSWLSSNALKKAPQYLAARRAKQYAMFIEKTVNQARASSRARKIGHDS